MTLQSSAQDLLAEFNDSANRDVIEKLAKSICGSDEWDDYSQVIDTIQTFLVRATEQST